MASCLDYALRFIHLYPKTEQELRTKLLTKKYSESEIDHTMAILKSKKYIDDKQFVALYVQSEVVKKGKLPAIVKAKLLGKGVDKSLVDEEFQHREDDMKTGILDRIRAEIKKYKKKGLDGYDIVVKIAQKGYRIHDIKTAIKDSDA